MVAMTERVTYMALVPGCPLVAKDVMGGAEHHHVRKVVAKAQEPGVSGIDFSDFSFLQFY